MPSRTSLPVSLKVSLTVFAQAGQAGAPCSLARRLCTVWASLIEGSLRLDAQAPTSRPRIARYRVSDLPPEPSYQTLNSSSHLSLPDLSQPLTAQTNQRTGGASVPMFWFAAHDDSFAWEFEGQVMSAGAHHDYTWLCHVACQRQPSLYA